MERTREAAQLTLGQVYATMNALAACERSGIDPQMLLDRHARGDRGEHGGNSAQWNKGERARSSYLLPAEYPSPTNTTVWLVTEPDRSITLLLLPDEF